LLATALLLPARREPCRLFLGGDRTARLRTWGTGSGAGVIAAVILAATRRRFPLTTLAYFASGCMPQSF